MPRAPHVSLYRHESIPAGHATRSQEESPTPPIPGQDHCTDPHPSCATPELRITTPGIDLVAWGETAPVTGRSVRVVLPRPELRITAEGIPILRAALDDAERFLTEDQA